MQIYYLEALDECFVVVTIDKAAKKFIFIRKIYYISILLAQFDFSNSESKTYFKAAHSIKEMIQANLSYYKKFEMNITDLDKLSPIMYRLPKIHKTS